MTEHVQSPLRQTAGKRCKDTGGARQCARRPYRRTDRSIGHRVQFMRLLAGLWYGWQTMPNRDGAPHFAPIRICSATLGFHEGMVVDLRFLNPSDRAGVRLSHERLRILYPADDYLIAKLDTRLRSRRSAIVSELTPAWLARCCPPVALELGQSVARLGLQQALDTMFTIH
jgi:hypothetical protein